MDEDLLRAVGLDMRTPLPIAGSERGYTIQAWQMKMALARSEIQP